MSSSTFSQVLANGGKDFINLSNVVWMTERIASAFQRLQRLPQARDAAVVRQALDAALGDVVAGGGFGAGDGHWSGSDGVRLKLGTQVVDEHGPDVAPEADGLMVVLAGDALPRLGQ